MHAEITALVGFLNLPRIMVNHHERALLPLHRLGQDLADAAEPADHDVVGQPLDLFGHPLPAEGLFDFAFRQHLDESSHGVYGRRQAKDDDENRKQLFLPGTRAIFGESHAGNDHDG